MSAVRSSLQPLPEAAADRLRSTRRPSRRPAALIDLGAVLLVWSVGAFYFFGREWSTGFRMVDGDSHDTVLQIYLQEHWFHVLNGDASWRNPAIFYPIKDVLGWSDGFVLFEVFYAPLRAVGFDIFLSAELTLILFSLVGFASFVYLTRLAFGVQRWVALIGGLAFTFANNLWIHLYWLQFPTVWMVPGLLLLAVLAFRCFHGHRLTALVLGALSGLGAALLFLTAFYVAWFCALAGGVALVILLLGGRGRSVRWLLRHWHESRWLVLTIGGAFAVGLVPFLATYLPAQKAIQHLSYSAVMFYAPTPRDLLNFGTQNVFWSPVARHVLSNFHLTFSALTWAVTPLVMVLAVAGSALAWWTTRSDAGRARRGHGPGGRGPRRDGRRAQCPPPQDPLWQSVVPGVAPSRGRRHSTNEPHRCGHRPGRLFGPGLCGQRPVPGRGPEARPDVSECRHSGPAVADGGRAVQHHRADRSRSIRGDVLPRFGQVSTVGMPQLLRC